MNPILVTGGAGFIGGEFVRQWISEENAPVINLDKLTYAGNLDSLDSVRNDPRHIFVEGDIGDSKCVQSLLANHRPSAVINFAAESHVDRSIDGPAAFRPLYPHPALFSNSNPISHRRESHSHTA